MKKVILIAIPILVLGGCATARRPAAMTVLAPMGSSTAQGTVHLQELKDGGVEVKVDLTGVPPGIHGFHVHEFGNCADNGNAAGGHFNPTSMPHSSPDAASHHAGDFGNVTAGANGEVHTSFITRSITSLGWPMTSRNCASTSSPLRTSRSILARFASSMTNGSLKVFR